MARVAMNADRRLTFEGFSLDLTNERLVCDGEVVALTPKAFAVLRRLVEGGGKLVTKAELLRAGWVDTHVSDGVIKLSILEIRRALGDDSSAPRFIETVPRRGYRLIAPRSRTPRTVVREDPAREPVGRAGLLRSSTYGSSARGAASGSSCSSPEKPASARPRCSKRSWRAWRPSRT